jgi:ribosomal-protein-serine acetyltransferase
MHELLMDIPNSIEASRLILRSYQHGDGKEYFSMLERNKAHLGKAASKRLLEISSIEDAEIYLRSLINDWSSRKRFVLGIWNKSTNEFVAEIWIEADNWEDGIFEIGWFAEKDNMGKGYVTEAVKASIKFIFESLKGHKIVVITGADNPRSYALAERSGFVKEGHLREQKKLEDGTWRGTLIYGLLKSEYNVSNN